MKFCKGPRGERNGKALSGADFSLRSSQSVNSHKTRPLKSSGLFFCVRSVAFRATNLSIFSIFTTNYYLLTTNYSLTKKALDYECFVFSAVVRQEVVEEADLDHQDRPYRHEDDEVPDRG